jgi:hypothetical protein
MAAFAAAIVGVLAYHAGVSHGLVLNPQMAGAVQGWYPRMGFHPFGFVFPFFFLFFWFAVARFLLWGRPWRRACHHQRMSGEVPPAFEEWHRQLHERKMNESLK